jgi:hypothetical protein
VNQGQRARRRRHRTTRRELVVDSGFVHVGLEVVAVQAEVDARRCLRLIPKRRKMDEMERYV